MSATLSPQSPARGLRRFRNALPLAALALFLLPLAVGVGWLAHRRGAGGDPAPAFDGFRQVRLKTIQAQLDQVQGDYLVILGDSHAERLFMPVLCGLPLVNAGISGASLADVLDLTRKVAPPRQAKGVLLVVGANDIWVKRNPETEAAEGGFRSGLAALKPRLAAWGPRRALIAIPPVADKEKALFPPAAAARYSQMLAQSCEPERCGYFNLYGEASDRPGRPSAFSDGVHLRDYAGFVRKREAELCSSLGIGPAR